MLDINEWIRLSEYGRKFKVRIWCGEEISHALGIHYHNRIHNCDICSYIKSFKKGLAACKKCRCAADKKAEAVGGYTGYCLHGMFEAVYPVMLHHSRVATVYITNIYSDCEKAASRLKRSCTLYGLSYKKAKKMLSSCEGNPDGDMLLKLAEATAELAKGIIEENAKHPAVAYPETVRELIYIAENHETDETLASVAKRFFLNEKYLGRLFKAHVGCTFSAYRNRSKLTHATELLINSDLKIIDIAIVVGYDNVEYFNRIFKKTYGVAPSEYRRDHAGCQPAKK